MSDVRTHTRRLANGKTVTVHRHVREVDPAEAQNGLTEQDQARRDRFERRVNRERQNGDPKPRKPRKRKKNGWTRAKTHAKKARRLWRRHKVRATAHGLAALGWAAGHGVRRGVSKARKTYQKWRKRRNK